MIRRPTDSLDVVSGAWVGEAELLVFRGYGPDDEQQIAILDADVHRYLIESEGPA